MTRRILAGTLLVIGLVGGAWAPPADAQTPIAMQALGQNVQNGSARVVGRGGWGLADSDTLSPGSLNPAALADLRFLALYLDGYSESTGSRGDGSSRTTRRVFLPEVRFAVPLREGRLAFQTGFSVKRSMAYEAIGTFAFDHLGDVVSGDEVYRRSGTLYEIPLGLAWRAADGLAVAGSVNLLRGTIDDALTYQFNDPIGNYYLPSTREQQDELSGANLTMAILWDRWEHVRFGAAVSTGYDLDMRRTVRFAGVAEQARSTFVGAMPPQYRAGLLAQLPRGWTFGADGHFAGYSTFSGRPDWEVQLRDEWTVAAGFERPLEFRTLGRGYRTPWRFGYQWRLWAHTVGGASVTEQMVSVGTGFPFRNRLGMLDLALSYVWTGSEAENGWSSRSLRLGLSITGLERLEF